MAESIVQVTEGSGKKLHTFQRTIGANSVEDEVMIVGEQYLASYICRANSAVSIASAAANSNHILQLMAGASLNVYVRSIRVYQSALATTATLGRFELLRLTTAGTGGGGGAVGLLDPADSAAGAVGMTLPTTNGTEGTLVGAERSAILKQTVAAGDIGQLIVAEWVFDTLRSKGLKIAAGTANGIVIKNMVGIAAATVWAEIVLTEANF